MIPAVATPRREETAGDRSPKRPDGRRHPASAAWGRMLRRRRLLDWTFFLAACLAVATVAVMPGGRGENPGRIHEAAGDR